MNMEELEYLTSETGSHSDDDYTKTITYPFGRYEMEVVIGANNEFIGITKVRINQDFLSHAQKLTPKGYHDVEEYYKE
jgi:hypothetical protein